MAKDSTPENPPARETRPAQNKGNVYTPPADGSADAKAEKAKNPPARDAFGKRAEPAPTPDAKAKE